MKGRRPEIHSYDRVTTAVGRCTNIEHGEFKVWPLCNGKDRFTDHFFPSYLRFPSHYCFTFQSVENIARWKFKSEIQNHKCELEKAKLPLSRWFRLNKKRKKKKRLFIERLLCKRVRCKWLGEVRAPFFPSFLDIFSSSENVNRENPG